MKKTMIAMACWALLPLAAQEIKLPPNLEKLADKAHEVVDVTMDGALLQLAARFLSDKDPDEARIKKLVSGLKGIYVKSFEFENRGEYQESDLEPLRAQLKAPGWSRIVGVRSKRSGENAEVYLRSDNGGITGLAVIAAEPKELTIVQIIGPLQPEDLRDLGGHFGIPRVDVGRKNGKEE
jgi:hypothetical protein